MLETSRDEEPESGAGIAPSRGVNPVRGGPGRSQVIAMLRSLPESVRRPVRRASRGVSP